MLPRGASYTACGVGCVYDGDVLGGRGAISCSAAH